MKQIRAVRHSFSVKGMANYRVQLAVPNNNHNHNNIVLKKLQRSTLKNYEFSTRVGTIVDRKQVLKQAGVVHNIKGNSRDTTVLIDLL